MRAPDNKLPPWKARSRRDEAWMIEWSISELDLLAAYDAELDSEVTELALKQVKVSRQLLLERAMAKARRGNPEPLRKMYPEIAEFIREPEKVQGQRRPYTRLREDNVFSEHAREMDEYFACKDVDLLRKHIWPQHYGRRRGGPSAEEIAAKHRGMSVEEVKRALKARSR